MNFLKSVIIFHKIGVGGVVGRLNGTLLFKYFDADWKYSDMRKVVGVFRCKVIGVFKVVYILCALFACALFACCLCSVVLLIFL